MSKKKGSSQEHLDPTAATRRRETPALEGREPLPEELTGRASGTSEDLETLFENDTAGHFKDGFRGGSDDDPETDALTSDAAEVGPAPDDDGGPAAA